MIISDQHGLAFVHIPKCAGTAIRLQLEALDSYNGLFSRKGVHPVLGPVDYSHLTLATLREHFPEQFQKLCAYRTFAIVRDPYTRFLSAALQHLQEFEQVGQEKFQADWVASQVLEIAGKLVAGQHRKPEYVHFTAQTAFVAIEGRRIVQDIFSFEDMAPLAVALRNEFGIRIKVDNPQNKSSVPDRAPVRAMRRMIGPSYRRIIPQDVRNRVNRVAGAARIINTPGALYERLLRRPDICTFIDSYYADDIALYRSLPKSRSATRP